MFDLIKTIRKKNGDLHFKRWLLWKGKDYEIYLHKIFKADEDNHLHNHPWDILWTRVIWGSYLEEEYVTEDWTDFHIRDIFQSRKAKAESFHKIAYLKRPVLSIMKVGPRRNPDWGFCVDGETIQHEEYRKQKRAGTL